MQVIKGPTVVMDEEERRVMILVCAPPGMMDELIFEANVDCPCGVRHDVYIPITGGMMKLDCECGLKYDVGIDSFTRMNQ